MSNKKNTFILYIEILIFIVLFTSCNPNSSSTDTAPPGDTATAYDFNSGPAEYNNQNNLQIFIDVYDNMTFYEQAFELLNRRVNSLGYNLTFIPFQRSHTYENFNDAGKYFGTFYNSYEDYLLEYRLFIKDNLNNNAAFIISSEYQAFIDDLSVSGELGNFYDNFESFAPKYYAEPQIYRYNDPDEYLIYSLPLYFNEPPSNYLVLLVKNEIYNEWNTDIRTASELRPLLEMLLEREMQKLSDDNENGFSTPCISFVFNDRILSNDLFLPEQKYMQIPLYLSKQRWEKYFLDITSNEVIPIDNFNEQQNARTMLKQWHDKFLLDIAGNGYFPRRSSKNMFLLDECNTAIIYLDDFLDPYTNKYTHLKYNLTFIEKDEVAVSHDVIKKINYNDLSDFYMNILYNDYLPSVSWGRGINDEAYFQTIAGPNAVIYDFLSFIECLYDQINYIKLFYGEENADYIINNGRITPVEINDETYKYWQVLSLFRHNAQTPVLSTAPKNLEDEISNLFYPYEINISDDNSKAIEQSWNGDADNDELINVIRYAFSVDE